MSEPYISRMRSRVIFFMNVRSAGCFLKTSKETSVAIKSICCIYVLHFAGVSETVWRCSEQAVNPALSSSIYGSLFRSQICLLLEHQKSAALKYGLYPSNSLLGQ